MYIDIYSKNEIIKTEKLLDEISGKSFKIKSWKEVEDIFRR